MKHRTVMYEDITMKDGLIMTIEQYDEPNDYNFNAKFTFEYNDVILDMYHLDMLSGRLCRIWNSTFTINSYGENTIVIEIDNEWFDDELYGIEQKDALEDEMFDDAKEVFEMQMKNR